MNYYLTMSFTQKQTWLECVNPVCGHKADLLKERKFRCPDCKSLYDIKHNFSLLNKTFDQLKDIFDQRAAKAVGNIGSNPLELSGIWRFKEWVMPFLEEKSIVSLGEGICPIVKSGKNLQKWIGNDINLWILMEGMTPTGSFKDYGGTVLMSVAKAAGVKAVACASTGDTSAMAAAYSTAANIKCAVILPKNQITSVQLAQPLVHGARIINLPGDFDDCMKLMQELVKDYQVYPANSLNPARIEGHKASVFQIAQAFGWDLPDWISIPVGNGSNCSSIGKGLRLLQSFGMQKTSQILACQSEAANPLALSWLKACPDYQADNKYQENFIDRWLKAYHPVKAGETTATAAKIGDPVSRNKVMREIAHSNGAMEAASEKDLNEAVSVVGQDGYFVCPQTGIAIAAVRNAVKKGWIKKGQNVVVISTATGLKFAESAAANLQDNIIDVKDCRVETVAGILNID